MSALPAFLPHTMTRSDDVQTYGPAAYMLVADAIASAGERRNVVTHRG